MEGLLHRINPNHQFVDSLLNLRGGDDEPVPHKLIVDRAQRFSVPENFPIRVDPIKLQDRLLSRHPPCQIHPLAKPKSRFPDPRNLSKIFAMEGIRNQSGAAQILQNRTGHPCREGLPPRRLPISIS